MGRIQACPRAAVSHQVRNPTPTTKAVTPTTRLPTTNPPMPEAAASR